MIGSLTSRFPGSIVVEDRPARGRDRRPPERRAGGPAHRKRTAHTGSRSRAPPGASLRLRERTRVFKRDAIPFAAALGPDSYDIAFADPPYGSRKLDRVLESWRQSRFARIFAVEHARTHDVPHGTRRRVFEDTVVTIFRAPGARPRR